MAELEIPQPIICSPFEEPHKHWLLEEGAEPALEDGRRPAHYFYRPPGAEATEEGAPVGERVDLPLVNLIRERVRQWRADGWPGVIGDDAGAARVLESRRQESSCVLRAA